MAALSACSKSLKITDVISGYLDQPVGWTNKNVPYEEMCRSYDTYSAQKTAVKNFFESYLRYEGLGTCGICLETVCYPVELGCGHIFDFDCISEWIKTKNTCPFDRSVIDPSKTLHVYKQIETPFIQVKTHLSLRGNIAEISFFTNQVTGKKLKATIAKIVNLEFDYLMLFPAGRKLEGEKTLAEYNVGPKDNVYVFVCSFHGPCRDCYPDGFSGKREDYSCIH